MRRPPDASIVARRLRRSTRSSAWTGPSRLRPIALWAAGAEQLDAAWSGLPNRRGGRRREVGAVDSAGRVVQACGTAQAPTARALSARDRKWAGSARAASLVARSRSASAVNSVPPAATDYNAFTRTGTPRTARTPCSPIAARLARPPGLRGDVAGVHRAVVHEGVHAGSLARLGLHALQYASRAVASSSWTSCSRRKRVRIDVNHCYFVVLCLSLARAVVMVQRGYGSNP